MLKLKNQLQRQLNLFSAMERETISKNHVSPKNVRSRGNLARLEHTLFVALCLFSVISANAQTATTDPGVDINGVTWATRNVGMPGTFAASPEDPGMFYQWNRRVGWSSTDPMVNSDGGTEWNDTLDESDTWEKENDPCPSGWHVPTKQDLARSMPAKGVWVHWEWEYEIPRFFVSDGRSRVYFPAAPAAGYRMGRSWPEYPAGTWRRMKGKMTRFHLNSRTDCMCMDDLLGDYVVGECYRRALGLEDALMIRCVKDAQTATTATVATTATTDPGVVINGVTWATRNVGMPGTFVASSEDPGMLYREGSREGWSSTDPMVNHLGLTGGDWRRRDDPSVWDDPCPPGWHVPYKDDVRMLCGDLVQVTASTLSEPPGYWVGGKVDRIFMPALPYAYRMDLDETAEFKAPEWAGRMFEGWASSPGPRGYAHYLSRIYKYYEHAICGFHLTGYNMEFTSHETEYKPAMMVRCVKFVE